MATLSVTVPDTLVPRLVTAIQTLYPDITGTQAQIGKAGIARLLRDALAKVEQTAAYKAGEATTATNAQSAYNQAIADGNTIT